VRIPGGLTDAEVERIADRVVEKLLEVFDLEAEPEFVLPLE